MTIQIIIAILTIIGALLFFLSGLFLAKLKYLPDDDEQLVFKKLETEFLMLKEEHEKTQHKNANLSSQYIKLQENIDFFKEEKISLLKKNQDYSEKITQLKNELDESREIIERGEANMPKNDLPKTMINDDTSNTEITEEKQKLLNKIDKLQELLNTNKIKSMDTETLNRKLLRLETLEIENQNLTMQLQELKEQLKQLSSQSDFISSLENERNDLAIKVEVLTKQTSEIENLRDEKERLLTQNKELENLRARMNEIETENAALRSKGILLEPVRKPETMKIKTGFSNAFEKIIQKLSTDKKSRGAVVADELGLPVAGTGNNLNALAGMAAIFSIIDERIHTMLSLGELEKLVIVDNNDLTLTIYPFTFLHERLMLTTLTIGSGPETTKVVKLINKEVS